MCKLQKKGLFFLKKFLLYPEWKKQQSACRCLFTKMTWQPPRLSSNHGLETTNTIQINFRYVSTVAPNFTQKLLDTGKISIYMDYDWN